MQKTTIGKYTINDKFINMKKNYRIIGMVMVTCLLIVQVFAIYPLNKTYRDFASSDVIGLDIFRQVLLLTVFIISIYYTSIFAEKIKTMRFVKVSSYYIICNTIGVLLKYLFNKYFFESGGTFNSDLFNFEAISIFILVVSIIQILSSIILHHHLLKSV